jgi:hypothetical protein
MRCCPISSDERDEGCSFCFFRDKMKEVYEYPPLTAEKQLELIKEIVPGYPLYYASGDYDNFSFEEGLACRINRHWEHWNDKQKQQIKEILEWAK